MKKEAPGQPVYIVPARHGWSLLRNPNGNGQWDVQALTGLEEAAAHLKSTDELVLGLPVSAVLTQRLRLPTVEGEDFNEMVRIQVEKALPYAPDEVTSDYEVIEKTDDESVVSAVAVHNDRLGEIAAPLLSRGVIPTRVTVYAAQRAASRATDGSALLIYPEGESMVSAISENGKLSLAQSTEGLDLAQWEQSLPQLALSAEMQGIRTDFPNVLLDEACLSLRPAVEQMFASPPELVGLENPPAATGLNLLPETWRRQRAQLAKQTQWRKRLLMAGAAYGLLFFVALAYFFFLKLALGRVEKRLAEDAPKVEFVRATAAKWDALAPAIDPQFYPLEILLNLSESLPSPDVRITSYTQSARQISVEGEAKNAALAYQFAEAVKKKRELTKFQFDMGTPRILPGGDSTQFRLEGKPK